MSIQPGNALASAFYPHSARGVAGSAVTVSLNGKTLERGHAPERDRPSPHAVVLDPDDLRDDGDQVLEVCLDAEADAWNYLLEAVSVDVPPRSQAPPTRDEVERTVVRVMNEAAQTPEDYADEVQRMRVKLAQADIAKKREAATKKADDEQGREQPKHSKSNGPGRETIAATKAEATLIADAKQRKKDKEERDRQHKLLDDEYRAESKRRDKAKRKVDKARAYEEAKAKYGEDVAREMIDPPLAMFQRRANRLKRVKGGGDPRVTALVQKNIAEQRQLANK